MTSGKVFFYFFLSALAVTGGVAVRCYECFSRNDSNCADPAATSHLNMVECTPGKVNQLSRFLRSVYNDLAEFTQIDVPGSSGNLHADLACQKVDITDSRSASNYTVRTCTLAKTDDVDTCVNVRSGLSKSKISTAQVTFCDVCDSDGCNGASSLPCNVTWISLFTGCVAVLGALVI